MSQDIVAQPVGRASRAGIGARNIGVILFIVLAILPLIAPYMGGNYMILTGSRFMIFAIAAMSLDFLIGTAGLVSFGHAAYVGIGAYAAGILAIHGFNESAVALPVAMLAGAVFAFATGAIAVRTRGVYFIMITLAFAQMIFYVAGSLSAYGGDDGLTLPSRASVLGLAVLKSETVFFYFVLAILGLTLLFIRRLKASRFGRALRGLHQNRQRMEALGYSPYGFQLIAYGIAGSICAVAGFLLANQTEFVSPAFMTWQRSGDLIVMVIIGGAGTLYGALLGALAYLLMEEVLSHFTTHWKIIFGPMLVLFVLYARGGLGVLFGGRQNG